MANSNKDHEKLQTIIDQVLVSRTANLEETLGTDALKLFCSDLYAKGLVSKTTNKNPCFNTVLQEFKSTMLYMTEKEKFSVHCLAFIQSLLSVGGPASAAADTLEKEWVKRINRELPHLSFRIVSTPKQDDEGKQDIRTDQVHTDPKEQNNHSPASKMIWCDLLSNPLKCHLFLSDETVQERYRVIDARWKSFPLFFSNNMMPQHSEPNLTNQQYSIDEPHQSHGHSNKSQWSVSPEKPDDNLRRCQTDQVVPSDYDNPPSRHKPHRASLPTNICADEMIHHRMVPEMPRHSESVTDFNPSKTDFSQSAKTDFNQSKTDSSQLAKESSSQTSSTAFVLPNHQSVPSPLKQDINCHKIYMKRCSKIPGLVQDPFKLASSLKTSGFINQQQEDKVRGMEELSDLDRSNFLLKEVENMLFIYDEDIPAQKVWIQKFCEALQDQNTPVLMNLAVIIAKDCGIILIAPKENQ